MSNKVKLPKKEPKDPVPELRVLPKPEANDEVKWLESLESVLEFALRNQGPQRTARFVESLTERLREQGIEAPRVVSTPYVNTIPPDKQAPFPGNWEMERRLNAANEARVEKVHNRINEVLGEVRELRGEVNNL